MKYGGKRCAPSAKLDFGNRPKTKRNMNLEKEALRTAATPGKGRPIAMKHKFASDCHSHSDCSFDGSSPMEAMCQRAEELGLYYYTVSDHCECNAYHSSDHHESGYRAVAEKAWAQMGECVQRFPTLRFCKGIELGQPMQDLAAAEDALSGREYDFVIGSLHNLSGGEDFYHLGQKEPCPEQWDNLFSRYFQEILDMIHWGNFDSLAHITYPLRYLTAPGEAPSFDSHREELEAVLAGLIRADKALEMNTSRLLRPGAPRLPDLEVFTRYRQMGGKLVTLGSDAHRAEDLAQGIDQGMEILKQAGFTEFAVYRQRKPVLLPLE